MAKELQRKFEKSRVDAEAAYRKKLNSLLDIDSDPLTDPEVMRSAQASADNEREQGLLQMQRNIDAQRMAEERQAARQKKMEGTMDAAETRRRDQEAASMFKRQPLSEGGKFPDLTGDGKVTQADVLKGRKVFQEGGLSAKDMKSTFSSRASEIFKASGKELNFPNANPTVRSYSKGVDEGRYDTPERFNKGLKAFEEDLLAENFPEKFDKMEQAEIKAAAKRFPTKKGDDRKNKAEGSLMMAREQYGIGSFVKAGKKVVEGLKELNKDNAKGAGVTFSKAELIKDYKTPEAFLDALSDLSAFKRKQDEYANELIDSGVDPQSVKRILTRDAKDLTEGEKSIQEKFLKKYFPKTESGRLLSETKRPILIEFKEGREPKAEGSKTKDDSKLVTDSPYYLEKGMFQGLSLLGVSQKTIDKMNKSIGDIPESVADSIIYLGDKARDAGIIDKPERKAKAEGSLMMPEEGMPVDTYPNIPADEMDEAIESQLPDAEMEENYISYVMEESLNDDEQDYLVNVLQKDPRLSDILDKVITVASEFSGAGEVEGPGTGVSDSIPARLSDGEFVFTKKATDQLGADQLQVMMDDAERAYDGGVMMAEGGMMDEEDLGMSKTKEEIEKLMMGANRMPSIR